MANNAKPVTYIYDDVKLAPVEQIGMHQHHEWELSLVSVGCGVRIVGDTEAPFQAGDLVLIPPDIPHCWCFDNNITDSYGHIANITICFSTTFLDLCSAAFPALQPCIDMLKNKHEAVCFDSGRHDSIAELMYQMSSQTPEERSVSMLHLIVIISGTGGETIVGRPSVADKTKLRLARIRIFTSCNLSRDVSIADIARHVGMNRSAFCSFFRKAMGCTYVTYLNRKRIDKACTMLDSGMQPIANIAYACGFNSIPYFNRLFKKLTGLTPQEFRKHAQGKDRA